MFDANLLEQLTESVAETATPVATALMWYADTVGPLHNTLWSDSL